MAYVLSSISGNLISAASAGYAPTNSAEVSAIASAYQVVSSTATQLYAGTAYLTSVNEAPLSASRAGQAANATLATSAWYDQNGRAISSLASTGDIVVTAVGDDGTYVTSVNGMSLSGVGGGGTDVVSGTAGPYDYISADGAGAIYGNFQEVSESVESSVGTGSLNIVGNNYQNINLYLTNERKDEVTHFLINITSFGGTPYVMGFASGWYAPLYPDCSAQITGTGIYAIPYEYNGDYNNPVTYASGTPESLWGCPLSALHSSNTVYGTGMVIPSPSTISSIASGYRVTTGTTTDGGITYLISVNGAPISAMRSYYARQADSSTYASYDRNGRDLSALAAESSLSAYVPYSATSLKIGSANAATGNASFAQGSSNSAYDYSFAQGWSSKATSVSLAQGQACSAKINSLAQGQDCDASNNSLAQGQLCSAHNYSFAQGYSSYANSGSFTQGFHASAYKSSLAVGSHVTATNSATAFGHYNLLQDGASSGDNVAFVIGDGQADEMNYTAHDLLTVTKDGEITVYSSTADTTGTAILSAIRAISAAATGGVDSATVSAIASAYATGKQDSSAMSSYQLTADMSAYAYESSNSAKLDSTAFSTVSGSFLTAVPAGYATETYVDSAVSAKQDSSAMSAYALSSDVSGCIDTVSANSATWASASAISSYALSADVSGCIDTVSAQSANWGGSALALSAGPGIRFDKVDNTLVASVDETVLWEGSARLTSYSSTLSDSLHNYKYVDIYVQPNSADLNKRGNQIRRFEVVNAGETAELYFPRTESMENYHEVSEVFYVWNYNNGSDFTLKNGARWSGDTYASSITAYRGMVTKIVGICKI